MTLGIWSGSFDCAPADQAELEQIVGDNIYRDGMRGLNTWLENQWLIPPTNHRGDDTGNEYGRQPELEDCVPLGDQSDAAVPSRW